MTENALPGKKRDKHGREIPADPDQDLPMKRFAAVIDRDDMMGFLDETGNDRFETLMLLMQDPGYATLSFAALCKRANVSLHEVQTLYADGKRQQALLQLASVLPDLMEDVTADARTRHESCSRCDGFKVLPTKDGGTRPCPTCKGMGLIRRPGDRQARDLIFESVKLIKQSGPLVAIQNNFGGDVRMEGLLQKTRQITLDKKPVEDAPPRGMKMELDNNPAYSDKVKE